MRKAAAQKLPGPVYRALVTSCRRGVVHFVKGRYPQALKAFRDGWKRLPRPARQWDASLWLLIALGETAFACGRFADARRFLEHYLETEDHPPARLLYAFSLFKLGHFSRAKKELRAAHASYSLNDLRDPVFWKLMGGLSLSAQTKVPRGAGRGLHGIEHIILKTSRKRP